MFDRLSGQLGGIIERLRGRATLSEGDIDAALGEIRLALLEADVALPVVRALLDQTRERALGQEVLRSITPGQLVVKIVHDQLVETLGGEASPFSVQSAPPCPILVVGLQGAGKTTTVGKLAYWLRTTHKKKVLAVSLDFARPAAQEQLARLCEQAEAHKLAPIFGENAHGIARRAMEMAAREGMDVVLFDSAGRVSIAEEKMDEIASLADFIRPVETILVADAMTGQDALTTARHFAARLKLTGLVMTRIDGDARGGATLSMRQAVNCPIKLLGTGEKLDALEMFDPRRIAGRILGMGDIVGLVEQAGKAFEQDEAEEMERKLRSGRFDLNDFAGQLQKLQSMGGVKSLLSMLPGIAKAQKQVQAANIDEGMFRRQQAIIQSMTPLERERAEILNASRKRRVARGSGTEVQDVNRLLKQHKQMREMVKRVGKLSRRGGALMNPAALLGNKPFGR